MTVTGPLHVGPLTFDARPLRLIGGREYLTTRLEATADQAEVDDALVAAYDAVDADYQRGPGPIGIAMVLDADAIASRPADVFWPATRLLYAGHRKDGNQIRLRHFHDALCITPGPDGVFDFDHSKRDEVFALPEGYRLHAFGDGAVSGDDVLALWERETKLPDRVREERLSQVRVVATTTGGELVGVGTAYRKIHPQLGLELWSGRVFVSEAHRRTKVATVVNEEVRNVCAAAPDGAAGLLQEVENPVLRQRLARAVLPTWPFTFIGERADGATSFVHYFSGVEAPRP